MGHLDGHGFSLGVIGMDGYDMRTFLQTSLPVTGSGAAPANEPAAAPPTTVQPATTPAATASSGIGAGLIVLMVGLGVGGFILMGLGTATVLGGGRRVDSASRVRKD